MFWEALAGVIMASCAAAIAYMLMKPKGAAQITREEDGQWTCLRIRANRDIARVEVRSGEGAPGPSRHALRSGDSVEFRFPLRQGHIRVLLEDGSGIREMDA